MMVRIIWYGKASVKKERGRGRIFKGFMLHNPAKLFVI